MGGDAASSLISSSEEESLLEQEYPELSLGLPTSIGKREGSSAKEKNGTVDGESGVEFGGYDEVGRQTSSNCFDQRRKHSTYRNVLENYNELRGRSKNLEAAKSKILSYYPGAWIEAAGSMKLSDYDVPKTTSLLLIGPKGSGKSSLVNRISRAFEDDKFAPDRAQISYNTSVGDGTYFLQEYMIPRDSTSFCLYDTRSLSDESSTNKDMLTHWMTRGVHHGELVISDSDSSTLKTILKCKARQSANDSHEIRMVNFVIFVVNGVSILKSMYAEDEAGKMYSEMVAATFSCPFLSFKDDKPVVVVTHGDLLSLSDRARVRVHLGELLGISPTKQIFDIPGIPLKESSDKATELAIVDMLRYSLEHADRNLPGKEWVVRKVTRKSLSSFLCLLIALWIAIIVAQHSMDGTQTHCAHKHHVPACPPSPPVASLHRNLRLDEIGRAVSVGDGLASDLTRQEKLRLISTQESLVEVHEEKTGKKSSNQKHPSPLPPVQPQEEKTGKKVSNEKHSTSPPPPSPQEEKTGKKASNQKHSTPPPSLPPTPDSRIEWHSIRHLWLGSDYD